jgi:hypothetical protein
MLVHGEGVVDTDKRRHGFDSGQTDKPAIT